MKEKADSIGAAAADAEIARNQIEQTEQYLRRGRIYQDTSREELARLWIEAMREWARVIHPRPQVCRDTGAEFALRGEEPPLDAVRSEFMKIQAAALAGVEAMTEDEKDEFGEDMVRAHLVERDRRN